MASDRREILKPVMKSIRELLEPVIDTLVDVQEITSDQKRRVKGLLDLLFEEECIKQLPQYSALRQIYYDELMEIVDPSAKDVVVDTTIRLNPYNPPTRKLIAHAPDLSVGKKMAMGNVKLDRATVEELTRSVYDPPMRHKPATIKRKPKEDLRLPAPPVAHLPPPAPPATHLPPPIAHLPPPTDTKVTFRGNPEDGEMEVPIHISATSWSKKKKKVAPKPPERARIASTRDEGPPMLFQLNDEFFYIDKQPDCTLIYAVNLATGDVTKEGQVSPDRHLIIRNEIIRESTPEILINAAGQVNRITTVDGMIVNFWGT